MSCHSSSVVVVVVVVDISCNVLMICLLTSSHFFFSIDQLFILGIRFSSVSSLSVCLSPSCKSSLVEQILYILIRTSMLHFILSGANESQWR